MRAFLPLFLVWTLLTLACLDGSAAVETEAPPPEPTMTMTSSPLPVPARTPVPQGNVLPLQTASPGPIRPGCGEYLFLVTLQTDAVNAGLRVAGPANVVDVVWTLSGPGMGWWSDQEPSNPRVVNTDNRDIFGIEGNENHDTLQARFLLLITGLRQGQSLVLEMGHEGPGPQGTRVRIETVTGRIEEGGPVVAEFPITREYQTATLDLCAFPAQPPLETRQPRLVPKVVAFFYPWWSSDAAPKPGHECREDPWSWRREVNGRTVLVTAHTPIFRDGDRAIYRETHCWSQVSDDVGRTGWIYDEFDVAFLAEQMALARAYGVDGFAVSVHGDNPEEMAFLAEKALPMAERVGFGIAALYEAPETGWPFGDFEAGADIVAEHLARLLTILARSPAAMRVQHQGQEKVVVFVDPALPALLPDPALWHGIRARLDAQGIPYFLWSGPGAFPYVALAGFDGIYNDLEVIETLEVGLGLPPYSLRDERRLGYRGTAWLARMYGLATAYPAVPGWEGADVLLGPEDFEIPRDYGAPGNWGTYYRVRWEDALEHQPDWIVLTSWNEWVEGTELEPSDVYPPSRYDFLQATWTYACAWKGGCP